MTVSEGQADRANGAGGDAPAARRAQPAPIRQRRPPFPAHGMVYSPCCNVCSMDEASGYCRGCQRTLSEIARWAGMSDAEKLAVWRQLDAREARLRQAPASDAAKRAETGADN
jgi:predicted Fe-S protein YdhL (DUF1289 family)